jgi:malonate transporter and related proteins
VASVLAVTGPLYLLMALGWAVTRAGLFSKADLRILGR